MAVVFERGVAAKAGVYEAGTVGWSENGPPVCVLV